MTQYLLAINQPDGPPPPSVDLDNVMTDVNVMLREMKAAGAWVFNGALHPASTATVIRQQGGDMLMADGPYAESKEHIGGICVIEAPDLDTALEWARKLARAVAPLPIEVRPFQQEGRDR
jgi:hypothetical protein